MDGKAQQYTGRSLEEWVALVKKSGPASEKDRRDWLKKEHSLATNSAVWIAERAEGNENISADPKKYLRTAEQWVEEMFSGPKAALRPVYDELLVVAKGLGKDMKISPCRTILPFYRKHVFAQIKPVTKTRIDLGFSLGNRKATERLIDTGGFAKKDRTRTGSRFHRRMKSIVKLSIGFVSLMTPTHEAAGVDFRTSILLRLTN